MTLPSSAFLRGTKRPFAVFTSTPSKFFSALFARNSLIPPQAAKQSVFTFWKTLKKRDFISNRVRRGIGIAAMLIGAQAAAAEVPMPQKTIKIDENLQFQVQWISPGSFLMGTPNSEARRDKDEGPMRMVEISNGFYMGIYEVTQKQFETVMGYNPSAFQQDGLAESRSVESLSWLESKEFIRRLNLHRVGHFRLPTEAEWEYACRAGTTSSYYWGEISENWEAYKHGWINSRSHATTHPVGAKPPNPWGLHDMAGNVWEWCEDWYGPYSDEQQTNPTGPKEGKQKVFRGGSFYDFAPSARSGNRHRHTIDKRYTAIGFRVVWEEEIRPADTRKVFKLGGNLSLELQYIPAGKFNMGSHESESGRQNDEGPIHQVTVSKSYYIGRFEITQAQWEKVMGYNPSAFQRKAEASALPVERVTWFEAVEFANKLTALLPGHFRLPTEAEWEYACRAGSSTRYPWGSGSALSEIERYGWFNSRAEAMPHPVGRKLPNDWGLFDMHGNVWEWCLDGPRDYEPIATEDPKGSTDGDYRVIRGGSWFNEPEALRSANRHRHPPDSRQTNNGFRVVWIPE